MPHSRPFSSSAPAARSRLAAGAVLALGLALAPAGTARAEVIAKVDGQEITSGDLALVRQDLGSSLS